MLLAFLSDDRVVVAEDGTSAPPRPGQAMPWSAAEQLAYWNKKRAEKGLPPIQPRKR